MDFRERSPALFRILLLSAALFATALFLLKDHWILSLLTLAGAIYQGRLLLQMTGERRNHPDNIRFDEVTGTFQVNTPDPSSDQMAAVLNDAWQSSQPSRSERDSEFLFYKNIVNHVAIGLIIFKEDGTVEIINSAARKLLRVQRLNHLDGLKEISDVLVNTFLKLKTGGRELLRLKIGEDIIQLSIYAIELTLRGEHLKLVSIQNIQNELEEKEMEAWQNLVRVLTHEIMNSVTPISSLAGTVEAELRPYNQPEGELSMSKEQLTDILLSLQTISKRSEGLIQFVKEFRSLTNIPKPKVQSVQVRGLLDEVATLHKMELNEKGIKVEISVQPEDLTVLADKGMIGQILINLVKNAIQAFGDEPQKTIQLKGYVNDKLRPVISVKDNGPGIEPEAMEKVFIPFFTTKKSGSGIGLSLSRQIMRQHQGTLTVSSVVQKGTEFFLRF